MQDKTFGVENTLPRVPVPTLEESCTRLLEWCAPLLTTEQLAATEAAVADFLQPGSPAHGWQRELLEYSVSEGVHSWLDEFWRDRYLGRRDRIALNANFFFLLAERSGGQVGRAAELILGALDHKRAVDEERFPVTVQRGRPLSMEQHKYLFSSTRIPRPERDVPRTPNSVSWPGPSKAGHVVVFVRGNAFRLDVIGPGGRPHTLDALVAALGEIVAASVDRGQCVGHLTTKARAEWASSRQRLLDCHADNKAALETIETALFSLCLETEPAHTTQQACDRLLAGDSGSRWFDKAISFVVFPDGRAGINGEHCCLDGTTVAEFVDAIMAASGPEHAERAGARSQGSASWTPVNFRLDAELRADVQAAGESFAQFADDTVSTLIELDDFGAQRAKRLGMSPDAFVQLAFQLAHRRARGLLGATYESVSTRQFHHGRTEAMRVVTPEIADFTAAMDDRATDRPARAAAARRAAAAHAARAKQCQGGQAPEQHLWELQLLRRRRHGGPTPPLYESPGWLIMRDDCLSTSGVPSVNIAAFGFGATSGHCIGVAYLLLPDRLTVYLSTPRPVAARMVAFGAQLRTALDELAEVLAADGHAGVAAT